GGLRKDKTLPERLVMAMRQCDLPAGASGPDGLERDHVSVIAMRAPPHLEIEVREDDAVLVRDTEHVEIGDRGEPAVNSLRNGRIVISRQENDGHPCSADQ